MNKIEDLLKVKLIIAVLGKHREKNFCHSTCAVKTT